MQKINFVSMFIPTGIDLSKILGGKTKILGEKVVKNEKCMVFLN